MPADHTDHDLATALAGALDRSVRSMRRLGGGDVAESFRVELSGGETVFAKTDRRAAPGTFVTEAESLRWLRESRAVDVPEVLAVGDASEGIGFLVLEWIDEAPGATPREDELGRQLAALHLSGAPCFGREDRRPTGSRRLPNEPVDTWVELYRDQRLLPLARIAFDAQALAPATITELEDVADRLDFLAGDAALEPPSRLHGDLWAGNRIVARDGSSWLIDPAAHGGHREHDLSMMLLFGGFGEGVFRAYEAAAPLVAGFAERVPLHQLAPLVVHAIKFGGGYPAAVDRALAALR